MQQEEIGHYMREIDKLVKECDTCKTNTTSNIGKHYEKIRKNVDLDEFFRDCVKACEKDILRSHELAQLASEDGVSSSFFFELKRKKFLAEMAKKP